PRRIRAHLPSVKLIYIVRDPVARILSQYRHGVREGRIRAAFDEWIRTEDAMRTAIHRSNYRAQLARYAEVFDPSQIHVEFFEDFARDYRQTLRRIFGFLDLEEYWADTIPNARVNVTGPIVAQPHVTVATLTFLRERLL